MEQILYSYYMIVNKHTNVIRVFQSIWQRLALFFALSFAIGLLHHYFKSSPLHVPNDYIKILLAATGVFLGFRINSGYGRWWEARKIWGEIVNTSRSFGMTLLTAAPKDPEYRALVEELIRGQIAYVHSLCFHLRKEDNKSLEQWLSPEELHKVRMKKNVPIQILHLQLERINNLFEDHSTYEYRYVQLIEEVKALTDSQGKSERIKNTTFPWGYAFYTKAFAWGMAVLLPFNLIQGLAWQDLILCTLTSFVFITVEKVGRNLDNPFEGTFNDTPMTALCRTIEIDLLEMMDSDEVPEPILPVDGVLN